MFEVKKKIEFQETALEAAKKYQIFKDLKKIEPEEYFERKGNFKLSAILRSKDVAKSKIKNCVDETFVIATGKFDTGKKMAFSYEISWDIKVKGIKNEDAAKIIAKALESLFDKERQGQEKVFRVRAFLTCENCYFSIGRLGYPLKNVKKALLSLWADLKDIHRCYDDIIATLNFIK